MKKGTTIKLVLLITAIVLVLFGLIAFSVYSFFAGVPESRYVGLFQKIAPAQYSTEKFSYRPGNCYDNCSKYEVYMKIPAEYDYSKLYDDYTSKLIGQGYEVKTTKNQFITPPSSYRREEGEFSFPSYLRIIANKGNLSVDIKFEYKLDANERDTISPPIDDVLYYLSFRG